MSGVQQRRLEVVEVEVAVEVVQHEYGQHEQHEQPPQRRAARAHVAVAAVAAGNLSVMPRPRHACTALGRYQSCPNIVRWRIDQGFFCHKHAEQFWETHFIEEHQVVRLMREQDEVRGID